MLGIDKNYKDTNIVLQEIPGEITLVFTITGCSLNCKGCHSPYLWKKGTGNELSDDFIIELINKYKGIISCVQFMGGEWESDYLLELLKLVQLKNLKTCLYTGKELKDIPKSILQYLTFIKVGPYIEELGGLDSPTTNQRFIIL